MISAKVDTTAVVRRFKEIPANVMGQLLRTMTAIGYDLTGYIQQNKLQGQVLHHRTGNLSSHVHPQTTASGNSVSTVVSIDSNAVPYARIHEYGGYVKVPEVKGPLMVFTSGGVTVFTRKHRAFTANMPERSYMRSGLADRAPTYIRQIEQAVKSGIA